MKGARQSSAFTVQGLNQSGSWIVLDERRYPYPVPRSFVIRAIFVDTDEYFTHFRFVPEAGSGFHFSAFEIHGALEPLNNQLTEHELDHGIDGSDEPFDPWSLSDPE
jgi:hypothetical protein